MTQRQRKTKRNLEISQNFQKVMDRKRKDKKYDSKTIYDEVIRILADRYFLSELTIWRILKNPEGTKNAKKPTNPRQTSLFNA